MFIKIENFSRQHYETPYLTFYRRREIYGRSNEMNFAFELCPLNTVCILTFVCNFKKITLLELHHVLLPQKNSVFNIEYKYDKTSSNTHQNQISL
jgi:hypothetical protein